MRTKPVLLMAFLPALGLLSGCLVVPHKASVMIGTEVPEKVTQPLQPGVTTRQDVLHLLGRPDRIEEDGRYYFYHWTKSSVFWMIWGGYGGVGGEIPTEKEFVCLEFGPGSRLVRWERVKAGPSSKSGDAAINTWKEKTVTTPPTEGGKR